MSAVETLKLIGRPNAYYPNLAKPLGGVNSAVLFSQLFYWQDKATSDLGVYKTRDELEEETGLTHNEQRTAIKKLVDLGMLVVTEKRLDHKTFYKINNEKVNEVLADFAKSKNETPPSQESGCPEVDNVEIGEAINQSSLYQEITTEITNNKKINKKNSFDPISVKPKNLSIEAWSKWVEYRKEKGKKLTETSWMKHIELLESQNDPEAIIDKSIISGWVGLFPEKHGGKKTSATVQPKQSGMTPERQREYDQYLFMNGLT